GRAPGGPNGRDRGIDKGQGRGAGNRQDDERAVLLSRGRTGDRDGLANREAVRRRKRGGHEQVGCAVGGHSRDGGGSRSRDRVEVDGRRAAAGGRQVGEGQ